MKKKTTTIKKMLDKHKIQLILIVLAFALTMEIASITYIVYIKKHNPKPVTVYENAATFFTIYNMEPKVVEEEKKEEEPVEEKPIVIKKAPVNDK